MHPLLNKTTTTRPASAGHCHWRRRETRWASCPCESRQVIRHFPRVCPFTSSRTRASPSANRERSAQTAISVQPRTLIQENLSITTLSDMNCRTPRSARGRPASTSSGSGRPRRDPDRTRYRSGGLASVRQCRSSPPRQHGASTVASRPSLSDRSSENPKKRVPLRRARHGCIHQRRPLE